MRQRKRAAWPLVVYRYWVRLGHEEWAQLPEGAKQEADALRALWNHLVDAFARHQAEYRRLCAQLPRVADLQDTVAALRHQVRQVEGLRKAARRQYRQRDHPERVRLEEVKRQARTALQEAEAALRAARRAGANTDRSALSHLHRSFLAEAQRLRATSPATWAGREFILTQFLAAVKRFRKGQGGPPKRKEGAPKEVHFSHRFTEGGVPVARLFGRGQRVHLEPVPSAAFNPTLPQRQRKRLARTVGTFQVGKTTLSFRTLLHRPLPAGAFLKGATLVGRQVGSKGYYRHPEGGRLIPPRWAWSLQLTLELPPPAGLTREGEAPGALLDIDSRVCGDGRLRIGVLVDTSGREEALCLPGAILRAWQYKRGLQRKADQVLEETKGRLRSLREAKSLPLRAQRSLAHLEAIRAPGLWRLLHVLEEADAEGEALEVVRQWAARSTRLLREARGLERRYLGHRQWFYRNVALQLCRRYPRLAVTAPDTRALRAREEGEEGADLRQAATYRQLAALSHLLVFLRQAAAKTGTDLQIESAPAGCSRSGNTLPTNDPGG